MRRFPESISGSSCMTGLYAAMHFLVDLLCAWAIYAVFSRNADRNYRILVYNFCAFALQLPLGTFLDAATSYASEKAKRYLPLLCAALGAVVTVAGVFTHVWLLGLGNALFHVGAGVDVIRADFSGNHRGSLLGLFVSPGAVGLYLGAVLGKAPKDIHWQYAALLVVFLCLCAVICKAGSVSCTVPAAKGKRSAIGLTVCCFAVVILRSLTGFYLNFPWKADAALALVSVMAVALGKMAGGFAAARFGAGKTVFVSLGLSGIFFCFGSISPLGLAAMFLFNMSMPVTLYLLAEKMPHLPGFSFGLLTFGLFLGYFPVWWGTQLPFGPAVAGFLGCMLSWGILWCCRKEISDEQISV